MSDFNGVWQKEEQFVGIVSENPIDGSVTYELDDGRYVKFDARAIREYGLGALLKSVGAEEPSGRVDVIQHSKRIGTLPAAFHPSTIKSTSFWYEPRAGDFTRDGDKWIAANTLSPGDLEAVPGFEWQRN